MRNQFHTLTVKEVRRETADCVSVLLDVPAELRDTFAYKGGQYLTLRTVLEGEELRRSYSLCSAPSDGEWRVAVKQQEGGKFSTWANNYLKKGDAIEAMPPGGGFHTTLKDSQVKHYVCIAAGSGITPILSIVKSVLKAERASKVTLLYGNRNTGSIIFREELEGLKNRYLGRLRLFHLLSRERVDAELLRGRMDALKLAELLQRVPRLQEADEYFVCGPEEMVLDARRVLELAGVPRHKVHVELFGTGAKKPTTTEAVTAEAPAATAVITLDGHTTEVKVPYNQAVLDAAMAQGLDLPYACKGGVCSTCKAKLIEGEVDMEVHYGLEHDELDAGFVLTCQAFPKSERIVVDFDAR